MASAMRCGLTKIPSSNWPTLLPVKLNGLMLNVEVPLL